MVLYRAAFFKDVAPIFRASQSENVALGLGQPGSSLLGPVRCDGLIHLYTPMHADTVATEWPLDDLANDLLPKSGVKCGALLLIMGLSPMLKS